MSNKEHLYSIIFELISILLIMHNTIDFYFIIVLFTFNLFKDFMIIRYSKTKNVYKYTNIDFSEEPKKIYIGTQKERNEKFLQEMRVWMKDHYPEYNPPAQIIDSNKVNADIKQYEKILSQHPDKEQIKQITDQWVQVKLYIKDIISVNSKPKIGDRLKEAINS